MNPVSSIIIPCYNHGAYVEEAVASARAASDGTAEIILVDDGSTDSQTRGVVDRLANAGVQVIRQDNKGLAVARNNGIAASKGEFILPLDADNRIRPKYLVEAASILKARPEVGVVYGDAEYFGERSGRWTVGPFDLGRLMEWNYIDACAVYRRKLWEQVGGYDSKMPVMGLEDWDFWLGAAGHSWSFHYIPEICFDYRVLGGSMISKTRGREAEVERYIARKHGVLFRSAWKELKAWRDRPLPRWQRVLRRCLGDGLFRNHR